MAEDGQGLAQELSGNELPGQGGEGTESLGSKCTGTQVQKKQTETLATPGPTLSNEALSISTFCLFMRASLPPTSDQGLTLVHYSAQRQHIFWDTLGA